MLIYDLVLRVDDEWFEAVSALLESSALDMLDTGCFITVALERGEGCLRIRATAADQPALDRYQDIFAPDLRASFLEHFPVGVRIERTVWQLLGEHHNPTGAEST